MHFAKIFISEQRLFINNFIPVFKGQSIVILILWKFFLSVTCDLEINTVEMYISSSKTK